jgi:hypothetical protein
VNFDVNMTNNKYKQMKEIFKREIKNKAINKYFSCKWSTRN